jgi:TfoX/Sxy family transcriptional regulator of competence genes
VHKLPFDQYIMLVMSYEVFHLGLVLGNLYRGEIPNELLSLVDASGWNHGDQVVYRWLFGHMLLFFHDGRLNKVMNENSMGITARVDPSFDILSAASLSAQNHVMKLQAIEFIL